MSTVFIGTLGEWRKANKKNKDKQVKFTIAATELLPDDVLVRIWKWVAGKGGLEWEMMK